MIEAALRSLLVGLAVAVGLRIFRVRNVLAQKAAWGLVLVSAFSMPLLLPITAQWRLVPAGLNVNLPPHPETLLEELQARLIAKGGSPKKAASLTAQVPQGDSPKVEEATAPGAAAGQAGAAGAVKTPSPAPRAHRAARAERGATFSLDSSSSPSPVRTAASGEPIRIAQSPATARHLIPSPIILILTLYCGITALFLIRLVLGLFTTVRLWRTATPVPAHTRVRASNKVASPITIGSAILLPADYETWDTEKLRIVLAHEGSHIRQGDFYLQLLASFYSAVVWFSPLGWWLKHELAELAEAISDFAGIEEAASNASYAQILLEFAAVPRRTSIGVAMARPGSLSRRIERLLNDHSFRQCFAGGPRALVAVALVPLAVLAATALVRVQAAGAVHAVTGTQFTSPARAAAPTSEAAPTSQAASNVDTYVVAPVVEAIRVNEPEQAGPATEAVPLDNQELSQVPVPKALLPICPEREAATPEAAPVLIAAAAPAPRMRFLSVFKMAGGGMQEGESLSFDRTLPASGATKLSVSTGSGNIHLTRGSGSQIQIHGKIHVNRDGNEEMARQIAANPPIVQNGDEIVVGRHHDEDRERWRGISIDYQIEAPAGIQLSAISGSGDIVDEGVGQDAKLQTGSGDIKATSLEGPFVAKTGSGNIVAAQTGQGDVVAETGSGDIELKDIHGGFKGQTGSGDIKASGTPSAGWNLQTGSGNVELWTGNAALTLDASTGSGSVKTEHEMMVQGNLDKHHIRGELNGGGPTVRVQTGSGDVQIH